jgi:hypothetical protein
MRIHIVYINESTAITDEELGPIIQALQVQVDQNYAPHWGVGAKLELWPRGAKPPVNRAWMGIFDDSDQAGALGYHDLTPRFFRPVGKVFAKTDKDYGALVSVTLSHETLEMLGDPFINSYAMDPRTSRLYALENADAVEADSLSYEINDVAVSDFVLPEYFDPNHAGLNKPLSFCANVHEPFELAPGGYMSYLDLRDMSQGWKQVNARGEVITMANEPAARQVGERHAGWPRGSRRHRRVGASQGELVVSTVDAVD